MNTPTQPNSDPLVAQMQAYLQKSGYVPPAPNSPVSTGGSTWRPTYTPIPQSTPEKQTKQNDSSSTSLFGNSFLGKIGNGISSAEQAVGNDLTAGARAKIAAKSENDTNNAQFQTEKSLQDQIKATKAKGGDTTHLENALTSVRQHSISNGVDAVAQDVPESQKTTEQGLGDVLSLGVDALAPGGLSATAYGAAKGAATGLSNNEGVGGTLTDTVIGGVTGKILDVGFSKAAPAISDALSKYGKPLFDKISQFIPDSAQAAMKDLAQKATDKLSLGSGNAGSDLLDKVNTVAQKPADAVSAIGNKVKTAVVGTPEAQATKQTAQELANIKENISPTLSAKESKIAQSQGRVYAGKDATLLKGETPDQVSTSDQTARQAFTIHENIPNAGNMNASELHDALGDKVNEITQKLRPQLDATPLNPDSMDKINSDWQKIQKSQIENAPADQEANVAKRQKKFDAFLQKTRQGDPSDVIAEIRSKGSTMTHQEATQKMLAASKPPTLGDVWDTAIQYDNSISDAVKQAKPPLASESLLAQRAEWIQNRAILKAAINDSTKGLGATSQKAFQDMSDMLDAKSNIIKNTEPIKSQTLEPSKLKQFAQKHPNTAKVVGGVIGYEGLKKLGVPLP